MGRIVKHLKNNYKIIIAFILGIIISGGGVYAATVIAASSVSYSDNASLGATNVQDAIDKLNTKATTKIKEAEAKCPDGYKCIKPLCKRATTLHTETCSQRSTSSYCSGDGYTLNDTITYGNFGTKGVLTSGDAFDCDVNGDGVYDSETERFYYVSDATNGVTKDNSTAVLIYYNNVSRGVASNSAVYAYDESKSNNNGPVTAIAQLPTIEQWNNVSLKNTTRAITNENGENTTSAGNLPTAFSYLGYAARFLTYQEVYSGCFDGTVNIDSAKSLSTKCKYLMENTKYSSSNMKTYGGWLETPYFSTSIYARYLDSHNRTVNISVVENNINLGVRPVIEVSKTNIDY